MLHRLHSLTPEQIHQFHWLPPSCVYGRILEGKDFTTLASSRQQEVVTVFLAARKSAAGRCISEEADPG